MNLITKIAQDMTQLVHSMLSDSYTSTDIEQTTREVLQLVGQEMVKQLVTEAAPPYPDPHIPCPCGAKARYVRRRSASRLTLMGTVKVKRAYYLCSSCHKGHCPLDKQLGFGFGTSSQNIFQMPFKFLIGFMPASISLLSLRPSRLTLKRSRVGLNR